MGADRAWERGHRVGRDGVQGGMRKRVYWFVLAAAACSASGLIGRLVATRYAEQALPPIVEEVVVARRVRLVDAEGRLGMELSGDGLRVFNSTGEERIRLALGRSELGFLGFSESRREGIMFVGSLGSDPPDDDGAWGVRIRPRRLSGADGTVVWLGTDGTGGRGGLCLTDDLKKTRVVMPEE